MRRHTIGYDIVFFAAIAATLLALAPALAHLFELPRKLALPQAGYFTVQQIYRGWGLFGIAIGVQFFALVLLAIRSWSEYYVFRPVCAALLLLIVAQGLFWAVTFPINVETANWTQAPADWDALRRAWEFSHAGGALCQLVGFLCLIAALFARVRTAGR